MTSSDAQTEQSVSQIAGFVMDSRIAKINLMKSIVQVKDNSIYNGLHPRVSNVTDIGKLMDSLICHRKAHHLPKDNQQIYHICHCNVHIIAHLF